MVAPLPVSGSVVLVPAPRGGEPLILRLGQQVVAEVLQVDERLGRALLSMGGRRVEARVPPGLERGTTIRLAVLDASPERLLLRLIPAEQLGLAPPVAEPLPYNLPRREIQETAALPLEPGVGGGVLTVDAALAELDLPPSPLLRAAAAALVEAGRPLTSQSLLAIRNAIAGQPGAVELNARAAAELLRLGLPLTARALDLARTALLQPAPIGDLLRELLEALDGLDRGGNAGAALTAPADPDADAGLASRSSSSSAAAAGSPAPGSAGGMPSARAPLPLEPGTAPAQPSTEPPAAALAQERAGSPAPAGPGRYDALPPAEIAGLRHALESLAITPEGGAVALRRALVQVAGAPEALPGDLEALSMQVAGAPEALPAEPDAAPVPGLLLPGDGSDGEGLPARVLLGRLIEVLAAAVEPAAQRLAGQDAGTGEPARSPATPLLQAGAAATPAAEDAGPRPAAAPLEAGAPPVQPPGEEPPAHPLPARLEAAVARPLLARLEPGVARPLPARLEAAVAGGREVVAGPPGAEVGAGGAAAPLAAVRVLAQQLHDRIELQQLANVAALAPPEPPSGAAARGTSPAASVAQPELSRSGTPAGAPAPAPQAPASTASGAVAGAALSVSLPFLAGGRLATLELMVQREPPSPRGAAAAPVPGVRARLAVPLDHLGEVGADLYLAPALSPQARPALRCRLAAATEPARRVLEAAAGELQGRLSTAGFRVEAIDCVVQAPAPAADAGTRSWPLRHINVEA